MRATAYRAVKGRNRVSCVGWKSKRRFECHGIILSCDEHATVQQQGAWWVRGWGVATAVLPWVECKQERRKCSNKREAGTNKSHIHSSSVWVEAGPSKSIHSAWQIAVAVTG